ncbi:hypothetical protein V6M85_00880 [Sulfolobus tengchongensis]|uniref:ATPase n=1 Tax=Sulfolobus tengchongensis TaxID=207809 RepID=A0AAX4L1I4_9CREN
MATADYFRGVAVGLLISGVTSLIAYVRGNQISNIKTAFIYVTILEIVLCVIFFVVSIIIRS